MNDGRRRVQAGRCGASATAVVKPGSIPGVCSLLVPSYRPGIGRGGFSLLEASSAGICSAAVRDSDRGGSSLQGFSLPGRYVLRTGPGTFCGGWTFSGTQRPDWKSPRLA